MNETINSKKYCSQLDILKAEVEGKLPGLANLHGLIFHQDNARLHVSVNTLQTLKGFGRDILKPPPYSPDMAPTYDYLFRLMEHSLRGRHFGNLNDIRNHLENFFPIKPDGFDRT